MSTLRIKSAKAMEALGACVAACLPQGYIALSGDLGAGKTTLTRGFLRHLGWRHRVKSPTYTIVEPYDIGNRRIYHIDLYRIGDHEELALLDMESWFESGVLSLIEWPQNGADLLPAADMNIQIHYYKEDDREVNVTCGPGNKKVATCLENCCLQITE